MAFRKTSVCDVFEDEPLTPEIQINDYRKKLIADPYFWVQGSPKSKRKSNTLVAKDNSKSQLQNGIYQATTHRDWFGLVWLGALFCIDSGTICQRIFYRGDKKQLFLKNKAPCASTLEIKVESLTEMAFSFDISKQ